MTLLKLFRRRTTQQTWEPLLKYKPPEEVAFNTEDTLVPCDNQFSILEGLAEAEAQENEIMANISLGEKSKQKKSSKHKSKGVPLSIRTRAMIGKSTGPKYNSEYLCYQVFLGMLEGSEISPPSAEFLICRVGSCS